MLKARCSNDESVKLLETPSRTTGQIFYDFFAFNNNERFRISRVKFSSSRFAFNKKLL